MKNGYLIGYDIRNPKRLRKVAKLLEGYGARKQYSLFYCRLTKQNLEQLRWELTKITVKADSLLLIHLCNHCLTKISHFNPDEEWEGGKVGKFEII